MPVTAETWAPTGGGGAHRARGRSQFTHYKADGEEVTGAPVGICAQLRLSLDDLCTRRAALQPRKGSLGGSWSFQLVFVCHCVRYQMRELVPGNP